MKKKNYTDSELEAIYQEAKSELMKIKDVEWVGFGLKETSGKVTDEIAFRVYVNLKKDKTMLSPTEIIPPYFGEFKTDVLVMDTVSERSCSDHEMYKTIVGGIRIQSNVEQWLASIESLGVFNESELNDVADENGGTLGYFGKLNTNNSKNNIVLLTNEHVLNKNGAKFGTKIFNPKISKTFEETKSKLNPIAVFADAELSNYPFKYPNEASKNYYIDCALGLVSTDYSSCCNTNCGVGFKPEINKLNIGGSNLIYGVARVTKKNIMDNPNYKVFKVGAKTGRTVGKIKEVEGSGKMKNKNSPPDNPTFTTCENIIHIVSTEPDCDGLDRFSFFGDSGSVVVNEKQEIIGLLFAGGPDGDGVDITWACHIHPILDRLKITLLSSPKSNNPSQKRNSAPQNNLFIVDESSKSRLDTLQNQFLQFKNGQDLYNVFMQHRFEVISLINHSRPVTLAWHRNSGPTFVPHFVKSFHEKEYQMPLEIKGITLPILLKNMRTILMQHGSPALKKVIEEYADDVIESADNCTDLETLLSNICNHQTT
jgi:hypothetical protein